MSMELNQAAPSNFKVAAEVFLLTALVFGIGIGIGYLEWLVLYKKLGIWTTEEIGVANMIGMLGGFIPLGLGVLLQTCYRFPMIANPTKFEMALDRIRGVLGWVGASLFFLGCIAGNTVSLLGS